MWLCFGFFLVVVVWVWVVGFCWGDLKDGDGMGLDCGVGWFVDNLLCFSFFSKRAQREQTFLFSILLFPGSFSLEGMDMAGFEAKLSSTGRV